MLLLFGGGIHFSERLGVKADLLVLAVHQRTNQ